MKKKTFVALVLVFAGNFFSPAYALTVVLGKAQEVFADPSDVVVALDHAGPCGSKYFHIVRAHANFHELTSVALTAFTLGKGLRLFVASCQGDRNILSHGSVHL
jgi:hypothetical protein